MHVLRHNDGAYSKLAMGPLWYDIISKMASVLPKSVIPSGIKAHDIPSPASKLNLFSGHDTTLLPLLATLGPNVWDGKDWTPYASMIVVELHHIDTSNSTSLDLFPNEVAFRIIFNGDIITSKVEGCAEGLEICDVSHLMNQVGSFASKRRDCSQSGVTSNDDNVNVDEDIDEPPIAPDMPVSAPTTNLGKSQLLLTAVISGTVGSLFTSYALRRKYGRYDRPSASSYTADGFEGTRSLDHDII